MLSIRKQTSRYQVCLLAYARRLAPKRLMHASLAALVLLERDFSGHIIRNVPRPDSEV